MIKKIIKLFPEKSFIRNFSVLVGSDILVNLISMITAVYIARQLSPKYYGQYAVLISTIAIFQVFANLGLQSIVIRTISRNQKNIKKIVKNSALAYCVGFLFALILFSGYKLFNPGEESLLIMIFMMLSMFANSMWTLLQNIAFGLQRMEYEAVVNIVIATSLFLLYVIVPSEYLSLEFVFCVLVFSQLIKGIIFYAIAVNKNIFVVHLSLDSKVISGAKDLIKTSFPYLIMGVFSMTSSQLPIIFLSENSGSSQVAFFNTANKLLIPITLVISAAMTALFPNLSRLYAIDKDLYKKRVETAFVFIVFFGTLGAVFVSIFRSEIVLIIFGEAYKNTGLVLAYQSWYMILFAMFCFFGSVFGSSDKQKLLGYLSVIYAILSVPVLWFGSFKGATYLSMSYLLVSIINMTYHWYYLQKILPTPFSKKFTFILFSSLLILFLASLLVQENLSIGIKVLIFLSFLSLSVLLVRVKLKGYINEIIYN